MPPRGGWGWLALPLAVMVVGGNVAFGLFFLRSGDVRDAARATLALGPVTWSILQLVLLAVGAWRLRVGGSSVAEKMGWEGRRPLDVAIGVAGALVASMSILAIQAAQGTGGGAPPWPRPVLVYWTFVTSVTAGLGEEVYFRAFLFHRFRRLSAGPLLLLTSAAFAIWHVSPSMLLHTFVVGLLFGALYLWTKRLLPVVIAHALTDLVGGAGMLLGWW